MAHALLSVSNKENLLDFARSLHNSGLRLISTGGTAKHLQDAGIDVTPIEEITGFPECFNGRVKTLHPRVHGGILYRRGDDAHEETRASMEIPSIDVVVVNLYPFEEKALKGGLAIEEAIEFIDIGGPTMIRSAAKNWEHVAVVTDPSDYARIETALDESGEISRDLRKELAGKAFGHTARYDALIAGRFQQEFRGKTEGVLPQSVVLPLDRASTLRYGENPHQQAASYHVAGNEDAIMNADQLQGKSISYNNLLDLDAAWNIACALPSTGATIIKHLNPCGVGMIPGDLHGAYKRALQSDPVSAFGGIVALNEEVDAALATTLKEIFLEIIAAPSFSAEALEILASKKNLRVLQMPTIDPEKSLFPWSFRAVGGGLVAQEYDETPDDDGEFRVVSKRQPTADELTALKIMWSVGRYVKSNAIVCGDATGTTSVGMGQTSRVDAVKLCAMKAHMNLEGSVAASDAFFPFRDGVDELASFGITAVIQPGGSIRDQEIIDAVDELGMAMMFTGKRHFRH